MSKLAISAQQDARLEPPGARMPLFSLAVADANWFTTDHLFAETPPERANTLLLRCDDYVNAWRRGARPWRRLPREPFARDAYSVQRRTLALPPGWMKRAPRLGMRPVARVIRDWRATQPAGSRLVLTVTYPHYLHLAEMVEPDKLVYLNLDDYSLYWPSHAQRIRELELELVRRADVSAFVSKLRCDEIRALVPSALAAIEHLPHGCPTSRLAAEPCRVPAALPSDLAHLPRPILGFVGSLEDRVDWALLDRLAESMPRASLVLLGRRSPSLVSADHDRLSRRSNVHFAGWRDQSVIDDHIRAFDVCLIPYRADHPFNRACCPTKIMDYMGAGRPIVSTPLPECLLHRDRFAVADDAEGFVAAVRSIVAAGSDDGRCDIRHAYAAEHTCRKTIERLLDRLG